MPHKVKLYGNNDGLVQFEDSSAAHHAPSFFNGHNLRGSTIKVCTCAHWSGTSALFVWLPVKGGDLLPCVSVFLRVRMSSQK